MDDLNILREEFEDALVDFFIANGITITNNTTPNDDSEDYYDCY